MSGKAGAAGAGAGAAPEQTPAPFEVSWEKLKGVFTQEVLNILVLNGLVAEHVEVREDVVGLKVNGETYSWFDIATQFESGELATNWGISQDILNKLLENGS